MKVGDKVTCIKEDTRKQFTVNNTYIIEDFVTKHDGITIIIVNDYNFTTGFRYILNNNENPEHYYMFHEHFSDIKITRKEKLKKIYQNE